tara:strand:+ start:368 stop:541 length:174 start_codon:yes stop_codon:yes gene_type:complete
MDITSAQYIQIGDEKSDTIRAIINEEEIFVPLDHSNSHYAEIIKQVEDGDLTIADAD